MMLEHTEPKTRSSVPKPWELLEASSGKNNVGSMSAGGAGAGPEPRSDSAGTASAPNGEWGIRRLGAVSDDRLDASELPFPAACW